MKKNIYMFIFISLIVMALMLVSIVFYTQRLVLNNSDKMIILSEFKSNGKNDNLSYRNFNYPKTYKLETTIYARDLQRLDGPDYKIVFNRVIGHWYKVYFNGILIGSAGDWENLRSNIWNAVNSFNIAHKLVKSKNTLTVEVYGTYEFGFVCPALITSSYLGSKITNWFNLVPININIAVVGFMSFASIFLIFLYGLYGKFRKEFLYYSLASLFKAIHTIDTMTIYDTILPYHIFKKLMFLSLFLSTAFISLAIYAQFKRRINAILAYFIVIGITGLTIFSDSMYTFQKGYVLLYIFILLNITSWIYTSACYFKRSMDAKVIFFGSLFLLLASVYDISFAFTWHYIKYNFLVMSVYGSLAFCISLIFLVVFKYLDMQAEIALESEKANSIYQLAIRDGMTGIYNHQYIVSVLQKTNQMYSLLMIDVDNLKKINDTYGHPTGDKVIKCVADIIKKYAGDNAIAGRYGGDEFTMILFDTAQAEALYLAQQIKTAVEEAGKTILSRNIQITLSIGLYTLQRNEGAKEAILKADKALYFSKNNGKAQINVYGQEVTKKK